MMPHSQNQGRGLKVGPGSELNFLISADAAAARTRGKVRGRTPNNDHRAKALVWPSQEARLDNTGSRDSYRRGRGGWRSRWRITGKQEQRREQRLSTAIHHPLENHRLFRTAILGNNLSHIRVVEHPRAHKRRPRAQLPGDQQYAVHGDVRLDEGHLRPLLPKGLQLQVEGFRRVSRVQLQLVHRQMRGAQCRWQGPALPGPDIRGELDAIP